MLAIYKGIKKGNVFISGGSGNRDEDSRLANGEIVYEILEYIEDDDMKKAQEAYVKHMGGKEAVDAHLTNHIADMYRRIYPGASCAMHNMLAKNITTLIRAQEAKENQVHPSDEELQCVVCGKKFKRGGEVEWVYHSSRGCVCTKHPGVMEWYNKLLEEA